MAEIYLKPMTPEMYHAYFQEYENDMALYLDKSEFYQYEYSPEKVNAYIERQISKKRVTLAVMRDEEMIGEVKLVIAEDKQSAVLGISMKNDKYKNKGYGTKAESLAVTYVFDRLNIPVLYADVIVTNVRSWHVLEKVGFTLTGEDEKYRHYKIGKRGK